MQRIWLVVVALAAGLSACTSDDELVDNAVAEARAQCEAQGKHFVLKEQPKVENGELMQRDVEINAQCVGPEDADQAEKK